MSLNRRKSDVLGNFFRGGRSRRTPLRSWLRKRLGLENLESRNLLSTFLVTGTDDANDGSCTPSHCSLREAISAANNNSGADTISFAAGVAGTINLASALPDLSSQIAIAGPGAGVLTVRRDSSSSFRILRVTSTGDVTLSGLTLSNGYRFGEFGGAILNSGQLAISQAVIADSTASNGGGIANGGTLTVDRTIIRGNRALEYLGGQGNGGGIANYATATVTGSAIHDNEAQGSGGGFYNEVSATLTVVNSTISSNDAGTRSGGGGAVLNYGTTSLDHSTVYNNTGDTGGGIANDGTFQIHNTIVAGNHAGSGPDCYTTLGRPLTSNDYNLIQSTAACTITGTTTQNIVGQDPLLGALQNNGGPTPTHALLTGSPAINAGDAGGVTNDQRGLPRPAGATADIGAFEVQAAGAPEIDVQNYWDQSIPDGDTTPSKAEDTDFGDVLVSDNWVTRSFYIVNTGTAPLTLTAVPPVHIVGQHAADFSVSVQPADTIAPGGRTEFQVRFDPSAVGVRTANILIFNDDPNEGLYDFQIQGTGITGFASTFTVTTTADPGDGVCTIDHCTVREAVAAANANPDPSRIVFGAGVTGTINLTGALPPLQHTLNIEGPGAAALAVRRDTGGEYRIFDIAKGANARLAGLTITNGNAEYGGGIVVPRNGTLRLLRSHLTQNRAGQSGGIASGGELIIQQSTVSGNVADDADIVGFGGGISALFGSLLLESSTVSGNRAFSHGAGINVWCRADIRNSTIVNNTSFGPDGYAGGINQGFQSQSVRLFSSIVAQNSAPSAPDLWGTFVSEDYNLFGSLGGVTVTGQVAHNLVGVDPQLGPLSHDPFNDLHDTPTHVPAPTSPVIDQGHSGGLATDQRWSSRIRDRAPANAGDGADIGAVELGFGYFRGTVFEDTNGTGTRDDGEPGLAGWTVVGDADRDGRIEASDPHVTTSADGSYFFPFESLDEGTYFVSVVPPAGWELTAPQAQVITEGTAEPPTPSNGYHSQMAASAHTTKWIQVDLGAEYPLDQITLVPARPLDFVDTPGFGFPVQFKVEVSHDASFHTPIMIADFTATDFANPGDQPVTLAGWWTLGEPTARYVRVTATDLWHRGDGYLLALAELQVWSDGVNRAAGRPVAALDSDESGYWSAARLVDGYSSRRALQATPGASWQTVGFPAGSSCIYVDFGARQIADPQVSLSVLPSAVAEDGTSNLVFTFTRSEPTSGALTVGFGVSGTASFGSGTDYAQSGAGAFNGTAGWVYFPPGVSTVSLTIDPFPDSVLEPDDTITLTLMAGTGYSIGTPNSVTGIILNDDTAPTGFVVTGLTPTASGFQVDFSRAFQPGLLNLYDNAGASLGAADVVVAGAAVGPVRGSLVVRSDNQQLTFIKTGGPLEPDTYTVTIRSAANALSDTAGNLLDGDANGVAGGDFVGSLVVAARPAGEVVVSVPDFARGFGQAVNLPNENSAGIPVTLSTGQNVTGVDLDLVFDPALLNVTEFVGSVPGAASAYNLISPGRMRITISSASEFSAAPGTIELGRFLARVPDNAPYAAKQVLRLENVNVEDSQPAPRASRADHGLHVAALVGDTNASRTYTSGDTTLLQRASVGQGSGFVAHRLVDPLLIADVNRSGTLTSGDATLLQRLIVGTPILQAPPAAAGITPPAVGGPDPRLFIPTNLSGQPGQTVTVPVMLDVTEPGGISASGIDLAIAYDSTKLTAGNFQVGPLLGGYGFSQPVVNTEPAGFLRVTFSSGNGPNLSFGQSGVVFQFDVTVSPAAGDGAVPINLLQNYLATYTTVTNNEIEELTLVPAPTNANSDAVDGVLTIGASLPTLAIAATDAQKFEGNSGSTAYTFTVTRSGSTTGTSTVTWCLAGSGPNPAGPDDFGGAMPPCGTLTFNAGETSKTIPVNVAGDATVEMDEGFTVTLSNASNAQITTSTATGTILNDDVAATVTASHSVTKGYPAQGGSLDVNCTLVYSAGDNLLSLLWRPGLPAGWTLTSVSGPGSPEIQDGEIVFTGSLPASPLSFSYQVLVPAGQTGTKQIVGQVEYLITGLTGPNPATIFAAPNPLLVDPLLYHSADYRDLRWVIDGTEVNRVLSYWRAGGYHRDLAGADGYAPGYVDSNGEPRHSADYRATWCLIDGTELNRVLSYWRAGGYHVDPAGADGYAPGAPAAGAAALAAAPRSQAAAATAITQATASAKYTPGGTVIVTGQIAYVGTPLSLLWRPVLPAGWTFGNVTGDGNIEVIAGEIVWTGALPASPVDVQYVLQVPANASGEQELRSQVETLFLGEINPTVSSATPDPLLIDKAAPPNASPSFDDIVGRNQYGYLWVAKSNGSDAFASSIWGQWSTARTWSNVMAGDFNGDGQDDVVGRNEFGYWWVAASNGSNGFASSIWGKWDPSRTWTNVMVGDFNGDGRDDLVARNQFGYWWVATSNGAGGFSSAIWGKWDTARTWTNVMVGDFNADGCSDLVARNEYGYWWVAASNGSNRFTSSIWGKWDPARTWTNVMVGDFNADGSDDLIGRNQFGYWWVAASNGSNALSNAIWGQWSTARTWTDVMVGDFDDNGADDVVGRNDYGYWWVAKSNGSNALSNAIWGQWDNALNWTSVMVGDFNRDGHDDVVGRDKLNYWWVQKSNGWDRFANEYWGKWNAVDWFDVRGGDFGA